MGLFGKLFDKKECSICGGEIGLLGNRKLEDGNCCKDCARKLSPWFDDRRHSTVDQIKQQLAYREENQRNLATFRPTKTYGERYELHVEFQNGVPSRFVVTQTSDYMGENADLLAFKDVSSFNIEIDENKRELMRENSKGESVSYVPPRYEYSYDFNAEIHINHPYCQEICFRLNRDTLNLETADGPRSRLGVGQFRMNNPSLFPEYRHYKSMCEELEQLFNNGMSGVAAGGTQSGDPAMALVEQIRNAPDMETATQVHTALSMLLIAHPNKNVIQQQATQAMAEVQNRLSQQTVQAAAAVPAGPKFCPNCGAPADGGKFCQSCGSRL